MGKEERTQYFVDPDQNALLLEGSGDVKRKSGEKKIKSKPGAFTILKTCTTIWPYLWPKGKLILQVKVIICFIILIGTRGISVMAPMSYKKLVNSLTESASSENKTEPNWTYIMMFIFLKSLHGNHGYLNSLRSFLWIRVSQNSRKQLRTDLFSHIMNLSLRWHLHRKTGEVLRVMDRGVDSINLILSQVLFNLIPAVLDVSIAIIFFLSMVDIWAGAIIFFTMIGYLMCTIVLSKYRAHFRREKNNADNQRNATIVDSILNFETVKYYAAENLEVSKYSEALDKHRDAEWLQNVAANALNMAQRTVMMLGLMAGTALCSWYVSQGRFTVGDYVLFATYLEQLYGPLNTFGAYYKKLQQAFVDMENMFEILNEKEEVVDAVDAQRLVVERGKVEFNNVSFSYIPECPVLKNISFTIPPGQTYALVGQSGGGKSTLVRLLLRFYDTQVGSIKIDDKDIKKVTQNSLRAQLGVVPQDTVLFNTDIRYNIRYGRIGSTEEEIVKAAKASEIHGQIVNFPDGYNSRVGERGLKVSGGEKQRIAIARTILKSPKIFLLDEATSALDTRTERLIQNSLSRMCQGKTTLVVAHRLSTIINADKIIVLKGGEIIETGRHGELLEQDGEYTRMWQEQLKSGLISMENIEDDEESNTSQENYIDKVNFEQHSTDFENDGKVISRDIPQVTLMPENKSQYAELRLRVKSNHSDAQAP